MGDIVESIGRGFSGTGGDCDALFDRAEEVGNHEEPLVACEKCGRVEGRVDEAFSEGVFYTCHRARQDTAFLVVREVVDVEGRRAGDVVDVKFLELKVRRAQVVWQRTCP